MCSPANLGPALLSREYTLSLSRLGLSPMFPISKVPSFRNYFHGIGIWRTQQLVQFLREHHWIMQSQYIQTIHPLCYINCICSLRYPLYEHLLMVQVTHYYHHMTHWQKAWNLKVIQCHTTTHIIQYWVYQMNLIQIQVCNILLLWIFLNHQTTSILKKYNKLKIVKRDAGVKYVAMTLSKS